MQREELEHRIVDILCDRWDRPESYGPEGRANKIIEMLQEEGLNVDER